MLHLEKSFDFNNTTNDESQLALQYVSEFENIKDQLSDFDLEE